MCETKKASIKAKVPCRPISVSKVVREPKSASCEARDNSLVLTSSETNLVSSYKTISALHRAKPHLSREAKALIGTSSEAIVASLTEALSREAKAKAPIGASSEATAASLTEALSCKAKAKAPPGANNEGTTASLKSRAMLGSAGLASSSKATSLSAQIPSPCETSLYIKVILPSSTAIRRTFKAKPKSFQPKKANFWSSRITMLDHLGPANTDMRDYLIKRQKLHYDESVHISLS